MKINTKNQKAVAEAYAAFDAKAQSKDQNKQLVESWGGMIERTTGVKDAGKLEWMSQLAHNTAKNLNEDAAQMPMNQYSQFGGAYSPYNTLYNTLGVGNPVPAGKPALTASDYATDAFNGSGDKYPALLPLALKVAAKTIGFELVNTTPLAGPTGVLPYMDYVYSGSKQPYGATPAYGPMNANPAVFNQAQLDGDYEDAAIAYDGRMKKMHRAFSLYGLPHAFKAAIVLGEDEQLFQVKGEMMKAGLEAGMQFTADTLVVEFVGWSRIDGDPIFKIVNGGMSLGEYFVNGSLEFTNEAGDITMNVAGPRLVSMQEDSLLGFTGAGELDTNAWTGNYQDGTVIYDPMSRGTGEMTAPRQISLQLFTKNVTVGTIQVGCAVTQEQVTDLLKQWGIDVIKNVENAGINELSQTINRHITSRLFALGWKNQLKLVEVEGPDANLNLTFTASATIEDALKLQTPKLAYPATGLVEGELDYRAYKRASLPYRPFLVNEAAHFENRDTLIKRIFTNILAASNWIQQRGRQGAATFVVTNITVATLLQSGAHYSFSPIENTVSQSAGQLYPIGTVCGLTVYVDPMMAAGDTRVLVGRKGAKDEPGVHFCPYVMAEVVRIIAEGTGAPKLYIKSRYALVDAGFFPETQYFTFCVDTRNI